MQKGLWHKHLKSTREYLRVWPVDKLPPRFRQLNSNAVGEIAYLLNGDSTTQPRFNVWHGMADPINLFIISRLLLSITGTNAGNYPNVTLYPVAGCGGMTPGRGSWDIWQALVSRIQTRKSSGKSTLEGVRGTAKALPTGRLVLQPVPLVVLSPEPWSSPMWTASSAVTRCLHRSPILADFQRAVTSVLDPLLPPQILEQIVRRNGVKLFGASTSTMQTLVYVIRRSGASPPHTSVTDACGILSLSAVLSPKS